jgi:hypothetical protein
MQMLAVVNVGVEIKKAAMGFASGLLTCDSLYKSMNVIYHVGNGAIPLPEYFDSVFAYNMMHNPAIREYMTMAEVAGPEGAFLPRLWFTDP